MCGTKFIYDLFQILVTIIDRDLDALTNKLVFTTKKMENPSSFFLWVKLSGFATITIAILTIIIWFLLLKVLSSKLLKKFNNFKRAKSFWTLQVLRMKSSLVTKLTSKSVLNRIRKAS